MAEIMNFLSRIRFRPVILDIYILKEILVPYFVFLFAFTALIVALSLQKGLTELLSKGVSPLLIFSFLKNIIVENLKITIPISGLFGGILAAGRMSSDSEITAMRAAGISFSRIYISFILIGVVSMILLLVIHMWYAPINTKQRKNFEKWITSYYSLAMISPGRFRGSGDSRVTSNEGEDIYAATREDGALQVIQIRRWWNELDIKNSDRVKIGNKTLAIGNGFITQIVHAGSGEMLKRKLPNGKEQKFLRLKKGFTIELNLKKESTNEGKSIAIGANAFSDVQTPQNVTITGVDFTDFSDGYLDYTIEEPQTSFSGIDTRPDIYTIEELLDKTDKIKNGGYEINIMDMLGSMGGSEQKSKMNSFSGKGDGQMGSFMLPSLKELEYQARAAKVYLFTQGKVQMPGSMPLPPGFDKMTFSAIMGNLADRAKKTHNQYQFEIQHRIAAPFTVLLFFYISFPLGLVVKRAGKSMSFTLALAVIVAFYFVEGTLTRMSYSGGIHPIAGAWLANAILTFFGIYLMAARTDSFSPFGFLRKPVGVLVSNLKYIAQYILEFARQNKRFEKYYLQLISISSFIGLKIKYKKIRFFVMIKKMYYKFKHSKG